MSAKAFFDTNVLIYALAQGDPRGVIAEELLAAGGVLSVQVLNEFVAVARRKLSMTWDQIDQFLADVRLLCDEPVVLDLKTHDRALELARRDGLGIYDALIVAAALNANCDLLYSEDMQHGRIFEGRLTLDNPFRR